MFTIYIIAIFPTIAVTTSIIRSSGIFRFLTDLVMFIITNKIHHDRSGSLHQSSKSDKSLNGHSRKGHSSGDGTHGYTNSLESDSSDHYGGYENDDAIMSGLFKIEHSEMEYLGETSKHDDKTHNTKIQNGKKH
jgi:hypothetical protein